MNTIDLNKMSEVERNAILMQAKAFERQEKERILQGRKALADLEDEAVNEMFNEAVRLSNVIIEFKRKWIDKLEPLKAMKIDFSKAAPSQESYTYSTKDGAKKAIVRYNSTNRYDDGINAGVEFAKEWLNIQAGDEKGEQLVGIIEDLLAQGNTGSYSPANLLKFTKRADEIGHELLKKASDCIRDSIYEESTSVSILMKGKDEKGIERTIPLSTTKA